jgi:hypothetical protein
MKKDKKTPLPAPAEESFVQTSQVRPLPLETMKMLIEVRPNFGRLNNSGQ